MSKPKISICKNCKSEYPARNNKKFCKDSCKSSYNYKSNKMIMIEKNQIFKEINRINLNVYKSCGWKFIKKLY